MSELTPAQDDFPSQQRNRHAAGAQSYAIPISRLGQLVPSRKALKKENKVEQGLVWSKVFLIGVRWLMLMINAGYIASYWLLSLDCPKSGPGTDPRDTVRILEFARNRSYLTNCGAPWSQNLTFTLNSDDDGICHYTNDGQCDDGGAGASYFICPCAQ